jgi:hypothetical protein
MDSPSMSVLRRATVGRPDPLYTPRFLASEGAGAAPRGSGVPPGPVQAEPIGKRSQTLHATGIRAERKRLSCGV